MSASDTPRTDAVDDSEVTRYLHNFSVCPGWNGTVSKAIAKRLLESEWVFCNGDMRDIRAKHLGCGVYKVYTEQRPL
jgi:hypothetical protein